MQPPPRIPVSSTRDERAFVVATRFRGCIVRCDLPRDDVGRILPPGLRLAAGSPRASRRHPVVFIFGDHDGSAVLFASLRIPTGVRFHEMVIAVPFVRAEGADEHVYLPRVFSTEPVVTWSGNAHYGYAKRMVPMEWLGDTYVVSDEAGALLAHAVVEPHGVWEPAATSRLVTFPAALAGMPVLGCREDGGLVRSHFEWDFRESWMRPLRASMRVEAPLARGIEPGTYDAAETDAVEVAGMSWRLSWPEP
jgi:hypothetical protein